MSITRQQAGTLYGNGFLLRDKEGVIWELILSARQYFVAKNEKSYDKVIFYQDIPSKYKIIARKPDLTIPIKIGGKEIVPIIELAKISFPEYEWVSVNSIGNAYSEDDDFFYYQDGYFMFDGINFNSYPEQYILFNWLFAHHYAIGFDETLIVWATNEYDN